MSETIINLTSMLVGRELDDFLAEYPPENPYPILFSLPYFRQRLIAKILSSIPNRHVVVEDIQALANQSLYLLSSLEERIKIEDLIKREIPKILIENYEKVGNELVKNRALREPTLVWEENYN
jgi:hypothetical protein